MAYTEEPIPGTIIKTLLNTEWDGTLHEKIPKPNIHEAGEAIRVDVKLGDTPKDFIEIFMTPSGEREIWRDAWAYADMTCEIQMKISTSVSRQRLYDLKQQVRRIIRVNKHNRTYLGTVWQAVRYMRFLETVTGRVNNWEGTCICQLEAAGVDMETS